MSSSGYNYGQQPASYPPPPPFQSGIPPQHPYPHGPFPPQPPPRKRGLSAIAWVLIVVGGLVLLSCAGFFGFLAYIGSVGPDTKVYLANEIPKRFVDTANELKLLDPGEQVKFFYSDGLTDVRDGMYLVTDRKVVVHIAGAATPTTIVPFGKIVDAELISGESWLQDGSITLRLNDDSVIAFPVSSEDKRDKLMFDAIRVTPPVQSAGDAEVER